MYTRIGISPKMQVPKSNSQTQTCLVGCAQYKILSQFLPSLWYCSIKIQYIRIIPIPILGLRSLQARSLRREMRCWTLKMHHICIETRNPIYLVMGTVSIQTGWALAYPQNGGKRPFLVSDARY